MKAKPLDYDIIVELHDRGVKGAEIARQIGATKGAVSKALKKLGREVTKCAVAEAAAHHKKKTAAVEHLLFLCDRAKRELEWIDAEVRPANTGDYRAWQDQKLKFAAEMRKLISAISEIGYKLFQVEEVSEILKIIDEEIGIESEECQKRIRDRIERRRAVRFPAIPN
jgi:DNA-binding FrmR family transcriptional regulator